MAAPAIAFEHLSKAYDGAPVVIDVDLAIAAGEFVALVGGSGSGKTTLLKTINRLVEPTGGRVLLHGDPVEAGPAHLLRRRIGYVFQEVGLFPHLSVAENIAVTLKLAGADARERTARVQALLDLVRLPRDFAARFPAALSGGQRQRVGVARALAAAPKVMLMDEPFGALDPATREALATDYRRLHESLDLTTLMVTHDAAEAVLLADRILVMGEGRIRADGAAAALLQHPDPDVRALIETPWRQAERVRARLGREPADG